MDTLLQFLDSIYALSEPLRERLVQNLQTRDLAAGEHLLKQGWICDKICFIEKGLFRCYYLKDEEEVCSWFMKQGDVILSVFSFFDQVVSYEFIQALEDSTVMYITYKEYEYLKKNFLEFNVHRATLLEYYYKLAEQRIYSLRMQRAQERFRYLLENNQAIVECVPDKYLASYLGMSASTFSRTKKKFFRRAQRSDLTGMPGVL
jgi:CRP-like cAMP-binding protein